MTTILLNVSRYCAHVMLPAVLFCSQLWALPPASAAPSSPLDYQPVKSPTQQADSSDPLAWQTSLEDIYQNDVPAVSTGQKTLSVATVSQQLPAGTQLLVRLNTPMDSQQSAEGDMFSASLVADIRSPEGQLIFPKGTTLRGQIDRLRRRSLFARGGALGLSVDHLVLPGGDLLTLPLKLSAKNKYNTPAGVLVADPGVPGRIDRGFQQTGQWMGSLWDSGLRQGEQLGGGAGVLLTAPVAAIGAGLGGAGLATWKTGNAVLGYGDPISLKPGDQLSLILEQAADVPLAQ
ncbi:MAG: hypothetical protein VKK59_01450 [Vampirovibrionales bacterium]|nr:hypothetical protein [Vampirovibrionales bacterium]